MTAIPRIREHHVFVLVIADPVAATVRARQFAGLPAQPAARLARAPASGLLLRPLARFFRHRWIPCWSDGATAIRRSPKGEAPASIAQSLAEHHHVVAVAVEVAQHPRHLVAVLEVELPRRLVRRLR